MDFDRYFAGATLRKVSIESYARSEEVCSYIARQWHGDHEAYLRMAVDELLANAVFHGALRMTGISREQWRKDTIIPSSDAISVTWASDAEKIGVAIEDPKGCLTKGDALRWLDQEDSAGWENREEHGRGLFLVRRLIDRFIINIDPGRRTECIILQYFKRDHLHLHKPLRINEL